MLGWWIISYFSFLLGSGGVINLSKPGKDAVLPFHFSATLGNSWELCKELNSSSRFKSTHNTDTCKYLAKIIKPGGIKIQKIKYCSLIGQKYEWSNASFWLVCVTIHIYILLPLNIKILTTKCNKLFFCKLTLQKKLDQ